MTALDRDWLADHPLPQPEGETDKNRRGRVLAAGGAATVPGALLLTGEAAFRAGAGKVQLATIASAALALGIALPEAGIYALPEHESGEIAAEAGAKLRDLLDQSDTLVVGPGMGAEAPASEILAAILARPDPDRTLLLDAAMLAAAPAYEAALRAWEGRIVLTPHPGEMARLMDCDEEAARADPATLAQSAADRFGAIVALKGPRTHIAAPGAPLLEYPGGGVGLATGGSGDVLAGIIAGLLARGAAPRVACAWGVWLHGEAGRAVAARVGPMGFLARELPAEVPALMAHAAH
jgi:hydroxyethylthiazole kinase-like uncharacterized protein yjeF